MQPPQPIIVIDLFPEILTELVKLLADLSEQDWQKPTTCPGWSVKDVALHLLGVDIGNLSRRRDGQVSGSSITDWDELVAAINDGNERWVRATRGISPRLLIDLLQFTGSQMCANSRTLDPYALGGAVSWVGPSPAPVWLDLAREYTERWHHQQHIRDAVGKPGLTQPKYFAPVLAAFIWAMPRAFSSTKAKDKTSVTLTITGEAGGQWSLLHEGETWRLYEGAPDRPDAFVSIAQEVAWRLFTRGVTPNVAQKQVSITGDRELGSHVHEMVSIIA